ncbi:MAG TPA: amino acid permease [Gemmatimonadales bacterium]|jgi:amino acid transporter|nr:amino acid permease [Gemmatimonadales bacterium]
MSTTPDQFGERLPRRLGLWSAVAVAVGSTIGSGIFRTPATVAARVEDVGMFLAIWVVGGIVAICGALTYAELAALFPRSGGIYVFIREGFGPLPAFLFGWAELLVIRPGAFGAISITASAYSLRLVGIDPAASVPGLPLHAEQLLAAIYVAIVALVNLRGIHRGAVLQNISTVFKVAALAALIVLGFALGGGVPPVGETGAAAPVSLSPVLLALVAILWAYDGWGDLAFVGGEVRDPQRNLPRALVLGTVIVVVLYLGANLVYLHLIPMSRMKDAELVAADSAQLLFGPVGVVLVSAAVAGSTFGTLNGSMMTSPRIFFALADDGLFPAVIARVDPKTGAPYAAIVLTTVLGMVFVLVRSFSQLADQFVIGIWPFYALAVAAIYVLRRRRPDLPRPYRTWGYPVVPAVFLVASLFLLGNYFVSQPVESAWDIGVLVVGIPVYWWWRRTHAAAATRL